MSAGLPNDPRIRVLQATPEQREAIAKILGGNGHGFSGGEKLVDVLFVLASAQPAAAPATGQRNEVVEMLSGIRQEIAGVRNDFREMRTAKERLERMLRDKMFAFTEQIDPESFQTLCAVLAHGDVAKASRALNLPDATLRSRIRQWRNGGPEYELMLAMLRWRKGVANKGTVPLNESITKGTAAAVDFPGLLSDVLDELLAMNAENWADKAEELAELLRPHVPR